MIAIRWIGIGVVALCAMVMCASISLAADQAAQVFPLWPDKAPGTVTDLAEVSNVDPKSNVQRITNVSKPTLTLFKAANAKGPTPAVVICPGGAYRILAVNSEGSEVAERFNAFGVTVLILKYRVPDNRDGAFQDIQRAVRLVRAHAKEWNIDPKRVGVMGFSAGGHLAARGSYAFADASYTPIDDADKLDCRPDFAILGYAAYFSGDDYKVPDSVTITKQTPPTFIVASQDDRRNVDSSIGYYLALKKAGVPTELHLFPFGGHGYGVRAPKRAAVTWPALCETWLNEIGMLPGGQK